MPKLRPAYFTRPLAQLLVLSLIWLAGAHGAQAQTPAFSYQGRLTDGGVAANGAFDLQFRLFDALAGGVQQGITVTVDDVAVAGGIFTVTLDFGAAALPGAARWLEISVRPGASGGVFTLLSPRQPITSTPYAVRSLNAGTATQADGLSAACVNCVTSGQIGGVNGSQISGAIPVASVPAGSGNYVQNTTTPQTASNFNISGDGTAGGTLAGNLVNATTQYNLGGSRVLSVAGSNNVFAGIGAGAANTTGNTNTFIGRSAGAANTSGSFNSFFGASAGAANTTAGNNAFFGAMAGAANTIGDFNAFFGRSAGAANTTGNNNAFIGALAGDSNTTGFRNTFIGALAGDVNSTGSNNAFIGASAGAANTAGSGNAFIGALAGDSNTTGFNNVFIGALAGDSNTTGFNNAFFGASAGAANTTANSNAFFGASAGAANTAGSNAFFGALAGAANTVGSNNAFIGAGAGDSNTTGNDNTFIGSSAGAANTTSSGNSFFGASVGAANTTGILNAFFGRLAGTANTTGLSNSFFGAGAGESNTSGEHNTFVGRSAGTGNTTGDQNTTLGYGADVGPGNLSNATALGAFARVDCSHCLVLGKLTDIGGPSTNVGIGTPSPATKLEVVNADGSAASVFTTSYNNTNNAIIGRQASGTLTAPSATASGLSLLFLGGRGHTGAGFATVSRVSVNLEASENWTATANGTRITFDTTANGTTSRVERMRIDHDGNVGIGTTNPLSKLAVLTNISQFSAIRGESTAAVSSGVTGVASIGSAYGIHGFNLSGAAGYFEGNVVVLGTLAKSSGAFKIDHPLDPANKYLYHSFVESPDMKNIYDGNVTTDAVGEAEVVLPDWFEALNRDFRYQLTVIGQFAQAIVAEKIKGNRFKIRTSLPQVEVSWQVTGIRRDAFAERHRIPVEEVKPERERGSYLHPAVFDQPEEKGVGWALRPEMMRQMKEAREKAKQPAPPPKPDSDKP